MATAGTVPCSQSNSPALKKKDIYYYCLIPGDLKIQHLTNHLRYFLNFFCTITFLPIIYGKINNLTFCAGGKVSILKKTNPRTSCLFTCLFVVVVVLPFLI